MKALIVCYKIERGKGSEDASGYHLVSEIARSGIQVTLLTRQNNIDKLQEDPAFSEVELVPVEVPRALSFYKRKGRGIILYYYLWQIFAGLKARTLQQERPFDVLHQLNFHADWAPHFLRKRGSSAQRLVWGPIAHHPRVPAAFLPRQGFARYLTGEWIRWLVKQVFWHLDPFLRAAIASTDVVLYASDQIAPPYLRYPERVRLRPYAASAPSLHCDPAGKAPFRVLSVGRLVPLKGFLLSVEAFAAFLRTLPGDDPEIRLTLIGEGPLHGPLLERASKLGVDGRIEVVGPMTQDELAGYYRNASVFLFPSFEGQGLVVAEALSASLPVICLSDTGPAFLAGDAALSASGSRPVEVSAELASRIGELYREFIQPGQADYLARAIKARERYRTYLHWDVITREIITAYQAPLQRGALP